ncbi:LIM domain-binding protein 2 [Pteropus alecto]|uniref:LIM domain-binding protein 2 n=1 Tax=Pteropus alecto TaxID=9402 RepID=L5K549_PTEAL|nr:LIM domain-binding protein 2 [Pteropus alecto]
MGWQKLPEGRPRFQTRPRTQGQEGGEGRVFTLPVAQKSAQTAAVGILAQSPEPGAACNGALCVILEPMQELMSRHKTYNLSPRDCLKTCLFQKWQRMVAPPAEPTRQPTTKRRKRKNSTSSTSNSSAGTNANSTGSKKKTPAANLSLSSQDVMVVGEPTLMGGEFGDEDERLITRLENTQYDAANGMDDEEDFNNSPALGNSSPWNSKPPATQETKSENPPPQASQ